MGAHQRQAATSGIVAGSVQPVGLSNRCRRAQIPKETTQALQGPQHPMYTSQPKRGLTYVLMVDIVLPALTYDALKLIDKLRENISGYSQNDHSGPERELETCFP